MSEENERSVASGGSVSVGETGMDDDSRLALEQEIADLRFALRQATDRASLAEVNCSQLLAAGRLTDAEAETLRELRDEAAQYADEIGLCASEVRGRQRIIDGLLVRLGGGR